MQSTADAGRGPGAARSSAPIPASSSAEYAKPAASTGPSPVVGAAERDQLAPKGASRGERGPEHEPVHGALRRGGGRERGPHPESRHRDPLDPRHSPQLRRGVAHAGEPGGDPRPLPRAGRVAGAGVVEPQDMEAVGRERLGQPAEGGIGTEVLVPDGRTEHDSGAPVRRGRQVHPPEQPVGRAAEPDGRVAHAGARMPTDAPVSALRAPTDPQGGGAAPVARSRTRRSPPGRR